MCIFPMICALQYIFMIGETTASFSFSLLNYLTHAKQKFINKLTTIHSRQKMSS